MPIFALDKELAFPPVHLAEPDGLLAIGGDLSQERILLAYRNGIFPWYQEEDILWWCPDPRFVLFPKEFKAGKSVKNMIRNQAPARPAGGFDFTINKAFARVIHQCKKIYRPGQQGTWITDEVEKAYCRMH